MKKLLIYTLIFVLAWTSPLFAKNEAKALVYDQTYGRVEEVLQDEKNPEILVKNEEADKDSVDQFYLSTKDVLVMDLTTGKFVKDYSFTKGEKVQYFYRKDTPILQSLPGRLTPDLIAVHLDKAEYSVDVDFFNKEGRGLSNRLELNVTKDTQARNQKGEVEKDFLNKDLVVLYKVATRSLPPIAKPEKILVLDKKNPVVDLEAYRAPENKGIYLRKYFEAMGAKVEWKAQGNWTRISMGDKFVDIKNTDTSLKIGENLEKMEGFSLEKGVSYIPERYLEKINAYFMD